ncbi:caffeic acid 3-O-methyltransferase [Selaginella moellendorffii]|nr:caffeic acid 3-O-methyltransferase [Selaginella moellendorffii]|eukprot:XP_002962074.2 caffeic acid 3-O-methyltransferase [Selaginella moellendorffii]
MLLASFSTRKNPLLLLLPQTLSMPMASRDSIWPAPRTIHDEDRQRIMELGLLCNVPMALTAAIRLDVFQIIASAGCDAMLSAAEIVARIPGCQSPALGGIVLNRILRVLASRGIFREDVERDDPAPAAIRRYGLTNLCRFLLKDDRGASLAPWISLNHDEILMRPWQFLADAVLSGGQTSPFSLAHGGEHFFQLASRSNRLDRLFTSAMCDHSMIFLPAILDEYRGFASAGTIVDVGGGVGVALRDILAAHPSIQHAINFDLPHVIARAPELAGVKHVAGDMFDEIPQGDTFLIKLVLHDWSDDDCLKILGNCHKSLASHGKLVIVDAVLPSGVEYDLGSRHVLAMDLLMLSCCPGGKERSLQDLEALAKAAGFTPPRVVLTVDYLSVIELHKQEKKSHHPKRQTCTPA